MAVRPSNIQELCSIASHAHEVGVSNRKRGLRSTEEPAIELARNSGPLRSPSSQDPAKRLPKVIDKQNSINSRPSPPHSSTDRIAFQSTYPRTIKMCKSGTCATCRTPLPPSPKLSLLLSPLHRKDLLVGLRPTRPNGYG